VTKRFVMATDPISAEEEKKLKDFFGSAGWWHWLPNFWLIRDNSERLSATSINQEFHRINSAARCIVLEVDEIFWAACTKTDAQGRDMATWLRDTWKS
jgi:hypothetical protein